MRHLKALILVSVALGTAGYLTADSIPDPIIKLTMPGGGSIPLCTATAGNTCTTIVSNAIGTDGFATIDLQNVQNVNSGLAASEMDFFFSTGNLDQSFFATTNDFPTVTLTRIFGCEFGCISGTLEVDFSGALGTGVVGSSTPGSALLNALPCDSEGCGIVGFTPGSSVRIDVTYNVIPDPPDCCDGLQPQEHAVLTLSAPEPGSFLLLLGAVGLISVTRRFLPRIVFFRSRGLGE